jgi:beta-lactamase superfamily II metal-dependent hydrolase
MLFMILCLIRGEKMTTQGIQKQNNPYAGVTLLPVTAGDATLIVWSDRHIQHNVLIDTGLDETEALNYLLATGIFHLDLIILSHPDMDHMGGLLAIINHPMMLVDRIWCFDLNFLREFIKTGTIPHPQAGTKQVVYFYRLISALDNFADILTSAEGKGIQVLQVSEGYRISLGGLLLEVLYPPEGFYHALSSPMALKQLLVNRKWPEKWMETEQSETSGKAKPLSRKDRNDRLKEMFERPENSELNVHLADYEETEGESNLQSNEEMLPLKLVGTLYNNLSIVVKLSVLGGVIPPSILFPGDLSDWTTLFQRQWINLKADILKMPHHGSKEVGFDKDAIINMIHECHRYYHYLGRFMYLTYPWMHGKFSCDQFNDLEQQVDKLEEPIFIEKIVNPANILVFPNPQHNLPSLSLSQFNSKIIANREDRDPCHLALKGNKCKAARLLIGLEQREVQELK